MGVEVLEEAPSHQSPDTVLLIEDNPGDRRLMREMLSYDVPRPYAVREAASFAEALHQLAEARADVALLDLSMPDSDGLETVERLITRHPDLPIVVLTGNQNESLALAAIKAGAQDYLLKNKVDGDGLNRAILHAVERKRITRQLTEARDTAERALAEKANYMAFLGHEIRTPLNAVIGFSRLLDQLDLPEDGRHYNSQISRTGDILLALINDMLDFSKLESGQLSLVEKPFDPAETVSECLDLMEAQAREKDLVSTAVIDASVPERVIGDGHRLRQILINLIGNAVKFTRAGSLAVDLYVKDQTNLVLAVADTGVGIPPDRIAAVFRPYQQASGAVAAQSGGTGLGLAISKRLVEMMGGRISVTSTLGIGSRFEVVLPLKLDDRARDRKDRFTGTALVVSPRAALSAAIVRQLQSLGGQARSIGTAKEAVKLMATLRDGPDAPSVVLVDTRTEDMALPDFAIQASLLLNQIRPKLVLLDKAGAALEGYDHAIPMPVTLAGLLCAIRPRGAAASADEVHQNLSILAVDDNAANRILCRAMLEKAGHKVETAEGGQEAVESVRARGPFDVVLMDMHMPDMDGATAARAISQVDPSLPVIALTGDDSLAIGEPDPFQSVFTKPVDWPGLIKALDALKLRSYDG